MAPRKSKAKKSKAKKSAARKSARRSSKKIPLSKRRIIKKIDYKQKKYGCYGAQVKKGKGRGKASRVFCARMDKKK